MDARARTRTSHSLPSRYRVVVPSIEANLFTEEGLFRSTVAQGVRAVNDTVKGIHLKANPELPGTEFAIGMLCHLLLGGSNCTPASEVLWLPW